jgi:hypothetical protein
MGRYVPPKRRFLYEPHCITSQKTASLLSYGVSFSLIFEHTREITLSGVTFHSFFDVFKLSLTYGSVSELLPTMRFSRKPFFRAVELSITVRGVRSPNNSLRFLACTALAVFMVSYAISVLVSHGSLAPSRAACPTDNKANRRPPCISGILHAHTHTHTHTIEPRCRKQWPVHVKDVSSHRVNVY